MAVLAWVAVATRPTWLLAVIAATFLLRLAAGPRLEPIAWSVVNIFTPRLPFRAHLVPGPPKRFAQLAGSVFTLGSLGASLAGADWVAMGLIGLVGVFATLESAAGFCAGCYVFGLLMKAGLIPRRVCEECANISLRRERLEGSS